MIKGKIGNLYFAKFNSGEELVRVVENEHSSDYNRRLKDEGGKWMFGSFSIKESIENIKNGSVSFDVEKVRFSGAKNASRIRRRKRYNDMGGDVDVLRALNGSIAPFIEKQKVSAKGRNKSFYISLDMESGVDSNDIYKYIKLCVDVITQAISEGYMVEVKVVFVAIDFLAEEKADMIHTVVLKDKRQRVDVKRIASIAYPAFYRLFVLTSEHVHGKRIGFGYGRRANVNQIKTALNTIGWDEEQNTLFTYYDFRTGRMQELLK